MNKNDEKERERERSGVAEAEGIRMEKVIMENCCSTTNNHIILINCLPTSAPFLTESCYLPHPYSPSSHEMCSLIHTNEREHLVRLFICTRPIPKRCFLFFSLSLHLFNVFCHLHDNFSLSLSVAIAFSCFILILLLIAVLSKRNFFAIICAAHFLFFLFFLHSLVLFLAQTHKQLSFSLSIPFTIVITLGSMYYLCIHFWTTELRHRTIQNEDKKSEECVCVSVGKYGRNDKKYFVRGSWRSISALCCKCIHWLFSSPPNRLVA